MKVKNNNSPGIITLENTSLQVVLSTTGGHLDEICDKSSGRSYLWQYQSSVWPRRTSICFPICGALPGGQYIQDGKYYELPIHGFMRQQVFTVIDQSPIHAELQMCSNTMTKQEYPFEFIFRLSYRLSETGLKISYKITNTSDSKELLFSVGSHYTYLLLGNCDDYTITLQDITAASKRDVCDNYLMSDQLDLTVPCEIPMNLVDGSSYILQYPKGEVPLVNLKNQKTGHEMSVRFSGFEYCLFWRPDDQASFVCIEPWSGIHSSEKSGLNLRDRTSITHLKPGQETVFDIEITVIG